VVATVWPERIGARLSGAMSQIGRIDGHEAHDGDAPSAKSAAAGASPGAGAVRRYRYARCLEQGHIVRLRQV